MGKVVYLAEYRRPATKVGDKRVLTPQEKVRLRSLRDKLIELEHILHTSPSVYSREKAVVDSIGVRNEILELMR